MIFSFGFLFLYITVLLHNTARIFLHTCTTSLVVVVVVQDESTVYILHIRTVSSYFADPVWSSSWVVWQINSTLNFCQEKPGKQTNVPLYKVLTFWEGYKNLKKNLILRFEFAKYFQKKAGDFFFKFCGLLTISEL